MPCDAGDAHKVHNVTGLRRRRKGTMVVCSVRRRSYKRNRHHKYSCWRNPCVVFFLTFASIGSLRLFRVPARSKQLLIKSRESWRTRQQNKRNMFTYQLQMEQEEPQQRLRKYMAVRPNGTPVSVREWAAAVVQASELSSPNHAIAGLESIFAASLTVEYFSRHRQ